MNLSSWAREWNIPPAALAALERELLGEFIATPESERDGSESRAQSIVRLEATRKGMRLFRNNVGVVTEETSIGLRFGLANDSKAMNLAVKSGDLIGIRPVIVTQAHVGLKLGVFTSREMKAPGWRYHPNDKREKAQMRWIEIINSLGGDAAFATGEGTL